MTKNITLKIDENILKSCRFKAVEANKSLSGWVTELLEKEISGQALPKKTKYQIAKERALKHLEKGLNLGGKPLAREAIYDRKTVR